MWITLLDLAETGTDFQQGSFSVTFGATTTNQRECVSLNILDDDIFEDAENFMIELASAISPLEIDPDRSMATVIIIDRDGES